MAESTRRIPQYEPLLDAYHRFQRSEFATVIQDLPLRGHRLVLDMPCGDGFYCGLLADWLDGRGQVVGLDGCYPLLQLAQQELGSRVTFVQGDAYRLPLADEAFDLVWCAQSLISLDRHREALGEMARVLRPGGLLVLLETDEVHHVMLPWRAELELAVRQAKFEAYRRKKGSPGPLEAGRHLLELTDRAGLRFVRRKTYTSDRQQPLDEPTREFFTAYLEALWKTTQSLLPGELREELRRLALPDSPDFLLDQPSFAASCMNVVLLAEKPDRTGAGPSRA